MAELNRSSAAVRPETDEDSYPLSGKALGASVGAAGGAAAGAAIGGTVGGRTGALIGAAIGTVAGGLAGKRLAESHFAPLLLSELHDSGTGRIDAAEVAAFLRIPLKQLAEALGKKYTTVHKTPSGLALQPALRSIKRSLEILERVFEDRSVVLAWLNDPHPELGRRTPMEVILEGHFQVVEDMLENALMGIPS